MSLKDFYESEAERWGDFTQYKDHVVRAKAIRHFISPYLKTQDRRLLDAGSGSGLVLSRIEGIEKYGIDISETRVKQSAPFALEVKQADICRIPYPDAFLISFCVPKPWSMCLT